MHFYEDPIKAKNVFITFLVLSIIFFIGCGVLGYLYWNQHNLSKRCDNIAIGKDAEIVALKKQIETLTGSSLTTDTTVSNLTKENTSLTNQVKSYKAKIAKATAYDEFFKYLNSVIAAHSGFTGWTDAEFEVGKQKAEATGDASFVSTINWAWYETTVTPDARVMRVWNEIASGIDSALNK